MNIEIIKAENGYLTKTPDIYVHSTLEQAIQRIAETALMHFYGKAKTFTGESYGEAFVKIKTEKQ